MRKLFKYIFPAYLIPFVATLLVFIFIKSFLFDVAFVRSPAMNNTLKQGQWVFVRKFFTPQRNEIVRISLPLCSNDTHVISCYIFKRIVAAAGDTVEIRNSKLYVNGEYVSENDLFLHNYIAKIKTQADTLAFANAGVTEKYLIDDSCVYMVPLADKTYNEIVANEDRISLLSNAQDSATFDENVFPYSGQFKWNEDFFGPLYIPKEGDTLALDTSSIKIYKRIIVDLENHKLEIKENEIFVDGVAATTYVTKKNYYFVTGDNFDNSVDSRNWGFVPEKKIKSKVLFNR